MKKAALFIISVLLFSSCSQTAGQGEKCDLYYISSDNPGEIVSDETSLEENGIENALRRAFELIKTPDSKKFVSAVPDELEINSLEVSDGTAKIDLTAHYMQLSELRRALATACITNTLCSFDEIESVMISCEGSSPAAYSPGDFVVNNPKVYYSTQTVNLYFANETYESLVREVTTVSISAHESLEKTAISLLIAGPKTDVARSAIPHGTLLNDIYVQDGVCVIDLSCEFVENAEHTRVSEAVTLFSIVNTITELPLIDSVKFLIDGNDGYGYTYFDISEPLTNASDLFE